MSLFLTAVGVAVGSKAVARGAVVLDNKMRDAAQQQISNKYRADGRRDSKTTAVITPCNPGFVEYVKDMNAYYASVGQSPLMTIEEAQKRREQMLKIFEGNVDSQGWCLTACGFRQN